MRCHLRFASLGLLALPVLGHGMAITALNKITPAATTRNTMVRVYAGNAGGFVSGSGTVIDIRHDASGPGGWICVLTADHVAKNGAGAGAWHAIGFDDTIGLGPIFDSRFGVTVNMLRGPMHDADHRVDLGLLGVRVADMSTLPAMVTPFIGSPRTSHVSNVGGYGLTATFDGPGRRYLVDPGTYGTFLASWSLWTDQPIFTHGEYRYEGVRYTTAFGPTDPTLPAIEAFGHPLSGDSGGPSWSDESFTWTLNGVHSVSSMTSLPGGGHSVPEGSTWVDVRVASYRDWIRSGCDTVVPEPTSFAILGLGLLALIRSRRRR